MANHDKAKKHHAKAGQAFARGDVKAAAHHMGHALAALRSSASEAPMAEESAEGEPTGQATPAQQVSMRDRLKRMNPKKLPDSYATEPGDG